MSTPRPPQNLWNLNSFTGGPIHKFSTALSPTFHLPYTQFLFLYSSFMCVLTLLHAPLSLTLTCTACRTQWNRIENVIPTLSEQHFRREQKVNRMKRNQITVVFLMYCILYPLFVTLSPLVLLPTDHAATETDAVQESGRS